MYVIKGDPIALARPRFGRRRVWDSQKSHKLVVGITLKNQHGSLPLYETPLILNIIFFMPVPKYKLKTNLEGSPHIKKPDMDNMIKFVCDISTGIIYVDDCIVYSISARKIYDYVPRTEFNIREF